jgi:hypothetical protein
MSRWQALAFGSVLVSALFSACSSDHDALKKKPSGSGGTGPDASSDADAAVPDAPLDAPDDAFVEPPGPSVLTLLHGVVDSPRIAFCFAKVVEGVSEPAGGVPLPPEGLAWGGRLSLASLDGLDVQHDDIQPIVIAASELATFAGKSCSELVALAESWASGDGGEAGAGDGGNGDAKAADGGDGAAQDAASAPPPPPPLRALELPMLPAGTLAGGYSHLLVATGCVGGPAFSDPAAGDACGPGYSPSSPNLGAVLVQLSRVTAQNVLGLQVVNAARAADVIDLGSAPGESTSAGSFSIASSVVYGAIVPKPPLFEHSKADFGSSLPSSMLEVVSSGATFSSTWAAALAAGGLSDVSDGVSYAIVLVGPRPSLPASSWWNGPRLVVIPTSPAL